ETQRRLEALARELEAETIDLPADFDDAADLLATIVYADIAERFAGLYAEHSGRMRDGLRRNIERGRAIDPAQRSAALARLPGLCARLNEILAPFDGLLTPATTGEAPLASEGTGSPVFLALWTLCGVPALSLPLLTGPAGLP